MMNKNYAAILLGLAIIASISAFEWPVAEVQPISVFGQKSHSSIECGLVLENTDIVRAAGNGTVLMTLEAAYSPSGFPGTLGNAAIIAHDEGLVTVYGNLASLDRFDRRATVETGTVLGQSGASACTQKNNTIFQVIDQTRRLFLNPLLLLPAQADTRRPVIKSATLTGGTGRVHPLATTRSVRQGKYRLHADITDMIDNVANELAPFRVTIILNGMEYASIPFEIIRSESGLLYLGSAEQDTDKLYSDEGFLNLGIISFARGRNDISIIARDISGNERSAVWSITAE